MNNADIIILAAGAGTRMNSDRPKVLLEVDGKSLINHLLETIEEVDLPRAPVIVVGHKAEEVKEALGEDYTFVHQAERKGTAHAVASAKTLLRGRGDIVMTLFGDTPFISKDSINKLIQTQAKSDAAFTMAVTKVPHFNDWYKGFHDFGRILRNETGAVEHNVEKKNFTPNIAAITEVNPGFYCFNADWLWDNIDLIEPTMPANEYYLPSLIDIARAQQLSINTVSIPPEECLGANTRDHLAEIDSLRERQGRVRVSA